MLQYRSEAEYKEELLRVLETDFHIESNVRVQWPLGGKEKEVDFLLHPKAHLIDNGFDDISFAIEAKSPIAKESVKKLLDCIIQAYTYSLCRYMGSNPAFILIYPGIETFFEYDFENKYRKDLRNRFSDSILILRRLMQRANIGELIVEGRDYEIKFAAARYYSSTKGRSGISNLGMVRRVGSRKIAQRLTT